MESFEVLVGPVKFEVAQVADALRMIQFFSYLRRHSRSSEGTL